MPMSHGDANCKCLVLLQPDGPVYMQFLPHWVFTIQKFEITCHMNNGWSFIYS